MLKNEWSTIMGFLDIEDIEEYQEIMKTRFDFKETQNPAPSWLYNKIRASSKSFHGHHKISSTSSTHEWIISNTLFEVEQSFDA